MPRNFTHQSQIAASPQQVFDWHAHPGAFQRLNPPWEPAEVVSQTGGIKDGAKTVIRVPMLGPVRKTWVAVHDGYRPGEQFRDTQLSGPFAAWEHTHQMLPDGTGCLLKDSIEYRLPADPLVPGFLARQIEDKLRRVFTYRHRVTADDIQAHIRAGVAPMKVLISGATGLVGSDLTHFLTTGGHQVVRLARKPGGAGPSILWDPETGRLDVGELSGIQAVVHLAGENIAGSRWTTAQKQKIRDSRVRGTRLLSERLAQMPLPPNVFVCASAIGYYGERGDQKLEENSGPGTGFLADVCRDWEAATEAAEKRGIRTVHARLGVVLSPKGGALQKMLTPFSLGGGGKLGSGTQYMSWVALDDVIGAIHHALVRPEVQGAMNVTAPTPVTNAEFTKILGKVLHRPTFMAVPKFALRTLLGEMADELLLASIRVLPQKLLATGYPFRFAELEPALRHLLGRTSVPVGS